MSCIVVVVCMSCIVYSCGIYALYRLQMVCVGTSSLYQHIVDTRHTYHNVLCMSCIAVCVDTSSLYQHLVVRMSCIVVCVVVCVSCIVVCVVVCMSCINKTLIQ